MRTIRLAPPEHPAWEQWIRDCNGAAADLAASVERGETPAVDDALCRRRSIRDLYFFSGGEPFFGKCAYCERPLDLVDGDVDHFRPKNEICDEGGQPLYITGESQEVRKHPGYHWLAYAWKNLFPACRSCNRRYKRALFPVEGQHATSAAEVTAEQPLLLDPSSEKPEDQPEKHLAVQESGAIGGKTYRGAVTIRVLGLYRDSLNKSRAQAYYAAVGVWTHLHTGEKAERAAALERLRRIREGREPHYLAQQAALAEMAARAGL